MMEKEQEAQEKGTKRGIIRSIFPLEYDFEEMLADQAESTVRGVQILVDWLHEDPKTDPVKLELFEAEVDSMRHRMEDKLGKAFSTPFDRQDIYSLSRQMDYVLNFSIDTAREIHAFGVTPGPPIFEMAEALLSGTKSVARGVQLLHADENRIHDSIHEAREAIRAIERVYVASMAVLLWSDDAMNALRKREIYHHLRDAGRALNTTIDILHRVVVGLS